MITVELDEPTAFAAPSRADRLGRLPAPRGATSAALLRLLTRAPGTAAGDRDLVWSGHPADAVVDDDLQLALWLAYELHYQGLPGVSDDWEWQPELLRIRRSWERQFLTGLQRQVTARWSDAPTRAADVPAGLAELAGDESGPSLSRRLMRDVDRAQFAEFLVHRSIYHLKEADPHTWSIPRLSGRVKAAMITIQLDEYGLGREPEMHSSLFQALLRDWDLDDAYGAYLDQVPGVTLMASNVMSLLGLHRRWRGALVGHLAAFEMTSSGPNGRYARGHRRLGGSDAAARFFDEHVVADAVHEQIAAHDLAGALATSEPELATEIIFGARCATLSDEIFAAHVHQAWDAGTSSLRPDGGS